MYGQKGPYLYHNKKSPPQIISGAGTTALDMGALEAEPAEPLRHDGNEAKAYTDNRRNFEPVDRK